VFQRRNSFSLGSLRMRVRGLVIMLVGWSREICTYPVDRWQIHVHVHSIDGNTS
jgi:hypothetical protein